MQKDRHLTISHCRKTDSGWVCYRPYTKEEYDKKYPPIRRILVNLLTPVALIIGVLGIYNQDFFNQLLQGNDKIIRLVSSISLAAGGGGVTAIFKRKDGEWVPLTPDKSKLLED